MSCAVAVIFAIAFDLDEDDARQFVDDIYRE